ncbi:MAG: lysophospholipid acyltransferase family protein [Nanoarchaeota archaeon]
MVYPIAKRIIPPVIKLYIRKVTGLENVPKKGAYVIAANHASYMDHLIITSLIMPYLNRKIHFLAKKEHFREIHTNAWHRWAGAIPIDRQAGGEEALKLAIGSLSDGEIISMYPEGTRSLDGKIHKGKTGIARIVLRAKVPVIPIGLIGTFEMLPKHAKFPKFKRAEVNIGKPMYFDKYYGMENDHSTLRLVTDNIMKEIAKLSNQRYEYEN